MKVIVDPNTEASGFGYVEASKYSLRIVSVERKEGEKAPYLKWEFELTDPNLTTVEGKGTVGHIFENTTLKIGAQFRLRQLCDALGMDWEDFDADDKIGSEVEAQVGIHEYNGVLSNEIKKFIPAAR